MASSEPPHVPVTIDFSLDPSPIRDHIVDLLGQVFPHAVVSQQDAASPAPLRDQIKIKRLTGGLTNVLFKVTLPGGESLNVRLFGPGSSDVIDRDVEKRNMLRLGEASLAPRLHATFDNGCVYEFVPGKLPKPQSLGRGKFDERLALEIGRWHGHQQLLDSLTASEQEADVKVWRDVDDWLAKAKQIARPDGRFSIDDAEALYTTIKGLCQRGQHSIGFCHNDLLPGNIVLKPCGGLTFIDVEYAGKNYHMFDVANHFSERVVDYTSLVCQWDHFPSADQQRAFFQHYLRHRDGAEPSPAEIDGLVRDLPLFSALSCLYWAVWAVVQSAFSEEKKFDYTAFAQLRYEMATHFFALYQQQVAATADSASS